MWLITPDGFFSIVEKASDKNAGTLTVRARVKTDLDALRQSTLPELGQTSEGDGTDYRYRATAPRTAVAAAMSRMVEDLHYSNFKSEVAKRQGQARAKAYHDVWDILYRMQNDSKFEAVAPPGPLKAISSAPKADAYGGILINAMREVLLIEPLNHFGGYVWTFPKGRPDPGETAEQAALREVLEETGYEAQIVQALPMPFAGSTTSTAYFLMQPVGSPTPFKSEETNTIRWASLTEAQDLVSLTKIENGRKRDKAVIEAVRAALKNWPY
jgi:ADP-ribose pyrophosphatase YjhB (NUDIX family)